MVGAKESTLALSSNMLASVSKLILESLININKDKSCFILVESQNHQLANRLFIKVHFRVQCFAEGDLLFTLKVSGFEPITLTSKRQVHSTRPHSFNFKYHLVLLECILSPHCCVCNVSTV